VLTALTEFIGWEATLSINIVVAVHLFLKNEPLHGGAHSQ
jgi:hypothetical protein